MSSLHIELKDFYRDELSALREDAKEFGKSNQTTARELELHGGKSDDPHVELLLQSFAYLSGRLRYQQEVENNVIPNGLLEQLYPHLAASVPSMAIMQLDVDPAGTNFVKSPVLARHRQFEKSAINDEGENVRCHFRTIYDTPVWPLEVTDVALSPTNQYDFLTNKAKSGEVHSVLRAVVSNTGEDPIGTMPIDSLRFYLDAESEAGYAIYDLLASQLAEISILVKEKTESGIQQHVHNLNVEEDFRWCGHRDDEAALPDNISSHPAYRLIQEYFAFPAKFLFCEVSSLNLEYADAEFEILFLLKTTPLQNILLKPSSMRLNCVPVVNLFQQALEPIRMDHRQYEYRVSSDWARHRYNEIYRIESLYAMRKDGSVRDLTSYYSIDLPSQDDDYFYTNRREESQQGSIPGTELYLSFLDLNLNVLQPADEIIAGKALCTNRRLPERLHAHDQFQLEGNGPIKFSHLAGKPSCHASPRLVGAQPWALISQLSLNYLSLSEEESSLRTLKSMLRLHVGIESDVSQKKIDSLRSLKTKAIVRNVNHESWVGFCRGVDITLRMDKQAFRADSGLLFVSILRQFLAMYAHVNSFVQLSLYNEQNPKEVWKQWEPLAGNQTIL